MGFWFGDFKKSSGSFCVVVVLVAQPAVIKRKAVMIRFNVRDIFCSCWLYFIYGSILTLRDEKGIFFLELTFWGCEIMFDLK